MLRAVEQVVGRASSSVPVAHLVPAVSRVGEHGIRQLVHVCGQVVVGLRDLAAANLPS